MKKALIHPIVNIVVSLTLIILIFIPLGPLECCSRVYFPDEQISRSICHTFYIGMFEMETTFSSLLLGLYGADITFFAFSIFFPKIRVHPVLAYYIVFSLCVLFLSGFGWMYSIYPLC